MTGIDGLPTELASPRADLPTCQALYLDALAEAGAIAVRLGHDADDPESELARAMKAFEVTLPLVGSFSAGKSSLINAFLGKRMLKTRLTPTTAVPTEIRHGTPPGAALVGPDGHVVEHLSLDDFNLRDLRVDETPLVRLTVENDRLGAFPSVVLVDIPGLESGLETHNRAIDSYLPRSVAYLVVAEVEYGLTGAVLDVLADLGLHEKPVAVAITKADKKTAAEVAEVLNFSQLVVRDLLGHDRFTIFATSHGESGQAGIARVLGDLRADTAALFSRTFAPALLSRLQHVRQHTAARLRYADADTAELDRQILTVNEKLVDLEAALARAGAELKQALGIGATAVRHRIAADLSAEVSTLAGIARDEAAFNRKLNVVVRQSVTAAVKAEIEPVVREHVDHLSHLIEGGWDAFTFTLDVDNEPGAAFGASFISGLYVHGPVVLFPLFEVLESLVGFLAGLFGRGRRGPSEDEVRSQLAAEIQARIIPEVVRALDEKVGVAIEALGARVKAAATMQAVQRRDMLVSALDQIRADRAGRDDEAATLRETLAAAVVRLGELEARIAATRAT